MRCRVICVQSLLVLAAALLVAAQQPQGSKTRVKTAEEQYKNIQVLKGTPADQMTLSMHVISGALGVECEYCHDAMDRSKDDKEPKRTARQMMKMVDEINKNSFDGTPKVSCYTCHRGSPKPLKVEPLPVTLFFPEGVPPAAVGLPTSDQILTRYIAAIGGEQAIRKVTSRVIISRRDIPTGVGGVVPVPGQVEQYQKAPNLLLNVSQAEKLTLSDGFDGTKAWSQNMAGLVTDVLTPDQERVRRSADFYESLDLKKEYKSLEVTGIEKVYGRDAYVIVGSPEGDLPEALYFDTQSGLLLRKETAIQTALGESPFQVDYEDYRNTGSGVKIPFVIHTFPATSRAHLQTRSTFRVVKVQDNVPIDNKMFVKPPSKPAAP